MLVNLISFFGGFLISSIIDTSLGEFSEWAIVGSSLVITTIELFNSFYYSSISKLNNTVLQNRYLFFTFFEVGW